MVRNHIPDAILERVRGDHERIRSVGLRGAAVSLTFNLLIGVAAAQEGTNAICGTSAADGITQTARFITGLLVLGCIVVAGLAEGYSRLQRDPQAQADTKDWRNGAVLGIVTVPMLIWFGIQIAGFFSIPVISCVDLVPYI